MIRTRDFDLTAPEKSEPASRYETPLFLILTVGTAIVSGLFFGLAAWCGWRTFLALERMFPNS